MSKEKKGMILFYEYRKKELKYLTAEQFMNVIMCLLELDQNGEIIEEKERLEEIKKDKMSSLVYDIMRDKTIAATEKWHELNDRYEKYNKNKNKKDTENTTASTTAREETHADTLPTETTKTAREGNRDNENDITKEWEKIRLMSEQEKYEYIFLNWPEAMKNDEDMERIDKQIKELIKEFGISQIADLVYFYDYNKTNFNQSLREQIEEMRKDKLPKFD